MFTKYSSHHALKRAYQPGSNGSQAAFIAAWKVSVSAASGTIGVRSAPPPNHAFAVTMKRVFMCTAGTLGERWWATSEMPEAQKCGS